MSSNSTVYLIHFKTKLHHAQHYLGFCEDGHLAARVERHLSGHGAKILKAALEAGIEWSVVRTWEGDRCFERHLKRRKKSRKLCPLCSSLSNEQKRRDEK